MGRLTSFILLFCMSIVRMSALNFFPGKFKVGELHNNVTLTCQTNENKIKWKRHEGSYIRDITESDFEKPVGRTLTLIGLQEDITGNYTCWSDRGLEDYTYVLLDKTKETTDFNINCTAETFSCTESIKCSWSASEFTTFRLRNSRDNGDWVSQSVDDVFFLPHSTNLYSEEPERLLITGEAISECCYMETNYSFFLRDIVKPANPKFSIHTTNEGNNNQVIEVEVKPPSSWPQPHSFFPLKHQVQYENRHNGKLDTEEWEGGSKFPVKGLIRRLRIRCRDPLLVSEWSEWSPWKNVSRNRTNMDKNKKTKKQKENHQQKRQKNRKNKKINKRKINWANL